MDRKTAIGLGMVFLLACALGAGSMIVSSPAPEQPVPAPPSAALANPGHEPLAAAPRPGPAAPDGPASRPVGDDPLPLDDLDWQDAGDPMEPAKRFESYKGKGILTNKLQEMHAMRVDAARDVGERAGWSPEQTDRVVHLLDKARDDALEVLAGMRDGELSGTEARVELWQRRERASEDLLGVVGQDGAMRYRKEVARRSRKR